jgi:pimeloyl-ACP methyl ester carboxylesterase
MAMMEDGIRGPQTGRIRKRGGCLRRIVRFLGPLLLTVAVVALAGMVYQFVATDRALRRFPPPGELVDVGGQWLHLYCVGEGSPTVVMESGNFSWSLDWSLVQPRVADFARACTYDRAGYGWSDPAPVTHTGQQIVTELHAALASARVDGPYVLVGHSEGGMYARLYAGQYPDEVVGMVLVDPKHEDFGSRISSDLRRTMAIDFQARRVVSLLGVSRLLGSRVGVSPCLLQLSPEMRPRYHAVASQSRHFDTVSCEEAAAQENCVRTRAAGRLGDMPLVVLVAERSGVALPGASSEALAEVEQIDRKLKTSLTALSSSSTLIMAGESGHYIQCERPELVVDAIRQVVEASR